MYNLSLTNESDESSFDENKMFEEENDNENNNSEDEKENKDIFERIVNGRKAKWEYQNKTELKVEQYKAEVRHKAKLKISKPRVFIPVFPV